MKLFSQKAEIAAYLCSGASINLFFFFVIFMGENEGSDMKKSSYSFLLLSLLPGDK